MNRAKYMLIGGVIWHILLLSGGIKTASAVVVSSPFLYDFSAPGVLEEAWPADSSTSPYFWLNSGGLLVISEGTGQTIQGPLKYKGFWQTVYAKNNPTDTKNGFYPQNVFKLITKSAWNNLAEEISFKIMATNLVESPNRDSYSGIHLLSRYKDDHNYYYAGVRMDGRAVIKKRVNSMYYTLGTAQVFKSDKPYHPVSNPNLLPTNQWMRMKTETKDLSTGDVLITLWIDTTNSGEWTEVLTATDRAGIYGNSPVIKGPSLAGVRTDFMDLVFDDYKLTEL